MPGALVQRTGYDWGVRGVRSHVIDLNSDFLREVFHDLIDRMCPESVVKPSPRRKLESGRVMTSINVHRQLICWRGNFGGNSSESNSFRSQKQADFCLYSIATGPNFYTRLWTSAYFTQAGR
jgi:hypothetical protein